MNGRKALSVLAVIQVAYSVLSLFIVIIGNNGSVMGGINLMPIINWIFSLAPFVLMMVYAFGFYRKPQVRVLLLICVLLPLLSNLHAFIENIATSFKYIKADALAVYIQTYGLSLTLKIFGIFIYVLLALYILKAFRNKKMVFILSLVYFIANALFSIFGNVDSLVRAILATTNKEFLTIIILTSLLNIIFAALCCAVWLIFTKTAVLDEN